MPTTPQRLVSLVPSTTESVCLLGAASRLIACTRYCTEPAAELRAPERIGGTKNPDREAIVALTPDLVLANAEENRAEDIEWLQQRAPVLVQTPRTVIEAAGHLRQLAERIGALTAVQPFLLRIEAQLAAAEVERLRRDQPPRAYYAVWPKPWMTVNRDTFVHDVLQRLGVQNVAADADADARYPEMTPEEAVRRGAEIVLLPSEPWEFDAAQRLALLQQGSFGDATLVLCDGRDFCWHGVRMADGLGRAMSLFAGLAR